MTATIQFFGVILQVFLSFWLVERVVLVQLNVAAYCDHTLGMYSFIDLSLLRLLHTIPAPFSCIRVLGFWGGGCVFVFFS